MGRKVDADTFATFPQIAPPNSPLRQLRCVPKRTVQSRQNFSGCIQPVAAIAPAFCRDASVHQLVNGVGGGDEADAQYSRHGSGIFCAIARTFTMASRAASISAHTLPKGKASFGGGAGTTP